MKTGNRALMSMALAVALSVGAGRLEAAEVTGTLGSPSATTTIDGKQLPPPGPKFGGVIGEKASESKAWWAARRAAQGCAQCAAHHDGR
jgi:hypothetical protein